MKTRFEMWVWESVRKIDHATGVKEGMEAEQNSKKTKPTKKLEPSLGWMAARTGDFAVMMMMTAYITINSGLVPLIEGLCVQILYLRFEITGGLRTAQRWSTITAITTQLWSTITAIFPCVALLWKIHGPVLPLYGTGWDRLDWDRLHRAHRVCPGTGTGLQRGYRACPWDRDRPPAWVYVLSLGQGTGLFRPFPVPVGQGRYWQHVCTMCLYQTCPTGTGDVPVLNLSHWDGHSACPSLPKLALDKV